jgi:hypothetical protein
MGVEKSIELSSCMKVPGHVDWYAVWQFGLAKRRIF